MMEGRAKAVVDSVECVINAGDAFITFPNQIHQYQKIDIEYYFVTIFPTELCPEFQNIFKHKVPVSPLIRNAGQNEKILPLVRQIVEANEKKTLYYNTIIKGYYLILLSELFQMMEFEDAKASDGNMIKAILNYCTANYTKELRLETISRELHVSKYYISHLFSQKLHMGFNEYIGMLRISDACKLLLIQDISVTEIAYTVGFNSMRTLNRLFVKYTGMTPSEYKKKQYSAQGKSTS
jgi:YesN/AraC family two-component response regulator